MTELNRMVLPRSSTGECITEEEQHNDTKRLGEVRKQLKGYFERVDEKSPEFKQFFALSGSSAKGAIEDLKNKNAWHSIGMFYVASILPAWKSMKLVPLLLRADCTRVMDGKLELQSWPSNIPSLGPEIQPLWQYNRVPGRISKPEHFDGPNVQALLHNQIHVLYTGHLNGKPQQWKHFELLQSNTYTQLLADRLSPEKINRYGFTHMSIKLPLLPYRSPMLVFQQLMGSTPDGGHFSYAIGDCVQYAPAAGSQSSRWVIGYFLIRLHNMKSFDPKMAVDAGGNAEVKISLYAALFREEDIQSERTASSEMSKNCLEVKLDTFRRDQSSQDLQLVQPTGKCLRVGKFARLLAGSMACLQQLVDTFSDTISLERDVHPGLQDRLTASIHAKPSTTKPKPSPKRASSKSASKSSSKSTSKSAPKSIATSKSAASKPTSKLASKLASKPTAPEPTIPKTASNPKVTRNRNVLDEKLKKAGLDTKADKALADLVFDCPPLRQSLPDEDSIVGFVLNDRTPQTRRSEAHKLIHETADLHREAKQAKRRTAASRKDGEAESDDEAEDETKHRTAARSKANKRKAADLDDEATESDHEQEAIATDRDTDLDSDSSLTPKLSAKKLKAGKSRSGEIPKSSKRKRSRNNEDSNSRYRRRVQSKTGQISQSQCQCHAS